MPSVAVVVRLDNRLCVQRGMIAPVPVTRLLMVVVVTLFVATLAYISLAHAVVIRLRDVTIENAVTVGPAVDSVLLDRVRITDNVPVVFDVAAMLPGPLRIEIKDCKCEGGAQIYVRGCRDEPATDRSLEVDVSGLTGAYCSLVFAYNLPDHTNVTICDSRIGTNGAMSYFPIPEMANVSASPLVLYQTSLSHMQLRMRNTVLKSSNIHGAAMYLGGGVYMLSSAVVLDSVMLEASGGSDASAMYVPSSTSFSLINGSVFSVTNVTVKSSGGGFVLGDHFTLSRSVLRFAGVEGHIARELVRCDGGTIETGGWLDLYHVWAVSKGSSVASLSAVTLGSGVVSFERCIAAGETLASAPSVLGGGVVSVQCNRAGRKMLQSGGDYRAAGLLSVNVVPCDGCAKELTCFSVLTVLFKDCACDCSSGGVGKACLPFDVPTGKTSSGGGAESCVSGVTMVESMTVGSSQATVCLDAVVFSGPITVSVKLRAMDVFADVLNVTLRDCLLGDGAQLQIESIDEATVWLLPRVHVNMANVTSTEGTIVFRGVLPPNSSVLLANSTLSVTVDGSLYVPTTAGQKSNKYGPALVLDGVRLLSAQFVMTRTRLRCGGDACAAILVEHGLSVNTLSAFYMDNCVVFSQKHVMLSLASDLSVGGGSVFSIQNNSWRAQSKDYGVGAMWFENVVLGGGSVLQFVSSTFQLGYAMFSMATLTVEDGSWLVHRDNGFRTAHVMNVKKTPSIQFRNKTVWSILRNNFTPGAYTEHFVYMTNIWNAIDTWSLTVYGMCDHVKGSPVTDYGSQLHLCMGVTLLDCDKCERSAMCFNERASGIKDCDCVCNDDGYGDTCLPAPVPDALGPIPLPARNNTEVECVYGGTVNTLIPPEAGESGLCFVGVTFTAAIVLDMNDFDAPGRTLNITLLQCFLSGLTIKGGGERVYVNVTSSLWESGYFSLRGNFGAGTQIAVVGNKIEAFTNSGAEFLAFYFGVNSTLLFLDNHIAANRYALYFAGEIVIDGGGVIVQGNKLRARDKGWSTCSAFYIYRFRIRRGGYFNIGSNEMSAYNGIMHYNGGTVESKGLLRVANCTFLGNTEVDNSALMFFHASMTLTSGAQWRVVNNRVRSASLFRLHYTRSIIKLDNADTTAVFANNSQVGSAQVFLGLSPRTLTLTLSAQLVVGCNHLNGVEATYGGVFPGSVTQFSCATCNDDAACYMPGVKTVSSGLCECGCKDGYHGASCLPFETPKIPVLPTPSRPVDNDTSCMVNQTLNVITLNMWKTHHCYVGVTFSGVGAVMKFGFEKMPLHLPINITFFGCTFRDGATVHFFGSHNVALSAGVLIRVDRAVMWSSVVSFSDIFPQHCHIFITNINAVQPSTVTLPDGSINYFSVVSMLKLVLNSSSLLISNVQTRTSVTGNSYGVHSPGTLSLSSGSSLYVQYCYFKGYTRLMNTRLVAVSNNSVFALINNTQVSGDTFFYHLYGIEVRDHSVFRIVGNKGNVKYGIYLISTWSIQALSWLDWRHIDAGKGAMFNHPLRRDVLNISNDSVVTLTGCKMGSTGLSGPLFKKFNSGYKFVVGCLTIAGEAVTTADDLERNYITNVTRVAECGKCSKDGDCFGALTDEVKDCVCNCASGGYSDVCVPAPVPKGPPSPPPPPLPPSFGECINDTMYPEVTQSVGSGLSWLCYRNVTFSGDLMKLTVDIGTMVGDVVNITFDGCRWRDGAVLLLLGSADAAVGSLSITITGNTFEDALLSPEGEFPPRTNITINGNHFKVTKVVKIPEFQLLNPSCLAMRSLVVNNYSTVALSGNTFQPVAESSRVIHVGDHGLTVRWHSLFAVTSNTFIMEGKQGTPLFLKGSLSVPSLNVRKYSAVVIQNNDVSMEVTDFFKLCCALHVQFQSAVVLRGNSVHASNSVFCLDYENYIYYDSWMQVSENLCRGQPPLGLTRLTLSLSMRNSIVAVSGNKFVSNEGATSVMSIMQESVDSTKGSIVLACNKLNNRTEATYQIPSGYNVTVRKCSDPCTPAASCFPAYMEEASSINCFCTCALGGYGDSCLPVNMPESPGGGGDPDSCVRDVTLNEVLEAGFDSLVVCYVGVTFAADVVVDVSMMSGSVRNVTLINCTMEDNAGLYVLGWSFDPPAGIRVDVWINGLVSSSGGGVLVANRYPPGSRVTMVDSTLVGQVPVLYRSSYNLGGVSACLVLYNVRLTGSVLTIARTQVVATFEDAVGLLLVGGVVLPSHGALYVSQLLVQTAMGLGVSVDGDVTASDGSVVSFVDSDFLLCKHAVSVSGAVDVSNSVVTFVQNTFASTQDNAVAFASTVSLSKGSMLMMKGNVHDSVAKEMLYAAGTVTVVGSTLSFVRNEGQFSRMLSVEVSLGAGAHMRAACNRVDGRTLTTAEDYAAAGFGNAESIDVVGCDTCDKETYCYASGTSSASVREGECVCVCNGAGHGEVCVPVGIPALPPARGAVLTTFALEDRVVEFLFVVPKGVREVVLRNLALVGVHPVIYVPWMAGDGLRIVVQNVSLQNGAVLYVMGGTGMRRAGLMEKRGDGWAVELSVCGVEAVNGAIALTGTFPAGSALTITDSVLLTSTSTPLVYLPDSQTASNAPSLVLWNLRLVRSVLLVSGVSFVSVVTGGRPVVADGAVLELVESGVALDFVVFGGHTAFHAGAPLIASSGSVLRMSESRVYAFNGLVFEGGMLANASSVVVLNNIGALSSDGSLVMLPKLALFVSGSWLSVRGNIIAGGLLSLPSYTLSANFSHSTLALYENTCSGPFVMQGNIALEAGARHKFVLGCLTFNGQMLLPMEYMRVGIQGETRTVACNTCDTDVSCFAALTVSMSSCRCLCDKGGYGGECLPVYLPRVDGCNRTPSKPPTPTPTPSVTPMTTRTPTSTPRLNPSQSVVPIPSKSMTSHSLSTTSSVFVTSFSSPSVLLSASPSVSPTAERHDVACPELAVTATTVSSRLTQKDIRNTGYAPARLMVALPSAFRWASDTQPGKHLTFVLGSAAQPSGFSGSWGVMLRNAVWNRSTTDPRSVLDMEVPVYGGYFIGADETIFIRGDPGALSGRCDGELVGSFTIASNTPPSLVTALSVINGAVASVTTVAVIVAGGLGSILEVQTLGVFAKMSCASVQERASSIALPYFLSVFAGLEDPLWMVVGNALIAAVFGCVHYGLTVVYQRWRGVDVLGAWAAMRFPSLTYLVAYLMQLGIFFSSVFMMAMSDAQARHYVVGVAGVLYSVAFPFGVCYFIGNYTCVSFTKYWQFAKKPFYERWMYPIGYWHPAAQQQMYGSIFTNMKGSYVYWCVFQLLVLCLVVLIAAVHPPVDRCHVLYFCMAAVLLAGAGVVAFTNMMRSAFLTVMHTTSFVLLAVLCLINAANYLSPNDGGVKAYAAMVLLLMTVLLAITVYSAVVWYVETLHWQSLREPRRGGLEELLNADTESDDNDTQDSGERGSSCFSSSSDALSYRMPLRPLRERFDSNYEDTLPYPLLIVAQPHAAGAHLSAHKVMDDALSVSSVTGLL